MTSDGLLLAATQIYLSLVKPQDGIAKRASLRWRAADEAFALNEHISMMERDDLSLPKFHTSPFEKVHGNTKVTNREVLEDCLHRSGGNVKEAADLAGIKRTTFWMAAKKAGLIIPKKTRRTAV